MPGIADKTEALAAGIRQWLDYHRNVSISFMIIRKGILVTAIEDGQPALFKRRDTMQEALQEAVAYIKGRPDPIGTEPRRVA